MRHLLIIPVLSTLLVACGQMTDTRPPAPIENIETQAPVVIERPSIEQPIVAVLLPQTGAWAKASITLQKGLIDYLYTHPSAFKELRFYNTDNNDIQEIYQQAIAEGAQAVIGPLLKEQTLALKTDPAIYTLTLNPTPAQDYTWALDYSIFGEAKQLALMAKARNFDRVGILAQDEEAKNALRDALINEGIFVVAAEIPPSNVVRQAQFISNFLGARASQERENQIRRIIGRSLETQPYIREDIHALVVSLDKVTASMIQPQRKFNYSPEIEVLASTKLPLSQIKENNWADLSKFSYILSPERALSGEHFLAGLGWDAAHLLSQVTKNPAYPLKTEGRLADYRLDGNEIIALQQASRIDRRGITAERLENIEPFIQAYFERKANLLQASPDSLPAMDSTPSAAQSNSNPITP